MESKKFKTCIAQITVPNGKFCTDGKTGCAHFSFYVGAPFYGCSLKFTPINHNGVTYLKPVECLNLKEINKTKKEEWVPHFKWSLGGDCLLRRETIRDLRKLGIKLHCEKTGSLEEIRMVFNNTINYKKIKDIIRKNEDTMCDFLGAVEFSVIKKSNKHGFESYGWPGADKIILFEGDIDHFGLLVKAIKVVEEHAIKLNS